MAQRYKPLTLTVKRQGSLLSKWMEAEITEDQFYAIRNLLVHPNKYRVVQREPMGFRSPEVSDARS